VLRLFSASGGRGGGNCLYCLRVLVALPACAIGKRRFNRSGVFRQVMSRWCTAGGSKSLTAPDICVTHVLQMSGNGCASISALYVSPYELPLKPTTMRNQILEAFRLFCKTSAISPNGTARLQIFVTYYN
jgi:hypothetical protein